MYFILYILTLIPGLLSHSITTITKDNELRAVISVQCSEIDSFAVHSSLSSKKLTLHQIEIKALEFKRVNKESKDWAFFLSKEFESEVHDLEIEVAFPVKYAAKYYARVFCEEEFEDLEFRTPESIVGSVVLGAKFKNSANLTTHIMNHLLCAINEQVIPLGFTASSPRFKSCKNEKNLPRLPIKEFSEEFIISINPDWSRSSFSHEISNSDLYQILKRVPQLKSLEILGRSSNWKDFPSVTLTKIKTDSQTITPSLSLFIENTGPAGLVFLMLRNSFDPKPTAGELLNSSLNYFMDKNSEKNVEIRHLIDSSNYSLYCVSSNIDLSGGSSTVEHAFDFQTTPFYSLVFQNSFISLKIWSFHLNFRAYIGVGDENSTPPSEETLRNEVPLEGDGRRFRLIGQRLLGKKVRHPEGESVYEAFFYYSITKMSQIVNVWFFTDSLKGKTHSILHVTKEGPSIEKMTLSYDHSFNVDPSEFLGFQGYKIRSNVNGRIFAVLLDNPTIHLTDKEAVRNAWAGERRPDYRILKTWKGNVSRNGIFEIDYFEDEDEDTILEELKEETRYQLVFFGESDESLKDSGLIRRRFFTPKISFLYNCEDFGEE